MCSRHWSHAVPNQGCYHGNSSRVSSPTYLSHPHEGNFFEFWPNRSVAFWPRPKNNRRLRLGDAAPPRTRERVLWCRRRCERMCSAHPGGEPRSAGRRGSFLGQHLHLPTRRLWFCWHRSEDPQREPRGRWCRTSWLHLGLCHALPVQQSHFPLPGFILLLFFLSLHPSAACFCFSLHDDPSQQGDVTLPPLVDSHNFPTHQTYRLLPSSLLDLPLDFT